VLEFGAFAFAAPWMLLAAAALPLLWWLLRVTPPAPRLMEFPAIRLLLALRPQEETPARTPLWLILLRMFLVLLIILALSHPLWRPGAALHGSGPLIIVVDDGWASAVDWPARRAAMEALIDRAERDQRPVRILSTARRTADEPITISRLLRAVDAKALIRAMAPRPWPVNRLAALKALENLSMEGSAHVAWISNGLGEVSAGASGRNDADALASRLQSLGSVQVFAPAAQGSGKIILAPEAETGALAVPVLRAATQGAEKIWLRAMAGDGRLVTREEIHFKDGAARGTARLTLPGEQRNAVTRLEIEDEASAGATFLLDERWRRRPVGLASGEASETEQPLLSSLYYLERALKPFSEVRRATINELLKREIAVLVLADIGKLSRGQTAQLSDWIAKGGVVVRFAGPKLARTASGLIPVQLRSGGRALGGAMSWSKPARLASFAEASPFAGLPVTGDVRIRRQVLAEPSIDLNKKTWARLSDGTPLVTAEKRDQGWLILVHTTANTEWSNLPLSGLFLNMLRRIVDLSQGVVADDASATLPPVETLDGFGKLGPAPSGVIPIPGGEFSEARAGPKSPPGFYGHDAARRALNLSAGIARLTPLGELPQGVELLSYGTDNAVDFKPWLLLAALVLLIADIVLGYALRGLLALPRIRRGTAAATIFACAIFLASGDAFAQSEKPRPTGPDATAIYATQLTRLAYVRTGDARMDSISRAGMVGLSRVLRKRTSIEPGKPLGIDIEADEMAFLPLLYWAVSPRQPPLSDAATEKLNQYLKRGGTILFDTRERGDFSTNSFGQGGRASQRLRMLLRDLDIPSLIPTPRDHVMTKAFYLLSRFPGRWAGGALWVERRGGNHNDGVSSVMIGANDWAGAWAVDEFGAAMFAVVPGGDQQRETAYRFGVNWVMYALTGNYKTDQVHVPAIIERLGQ
jgi:hypothetical protein